MLFVALQNDKYQKWRSRLIKSGADITQLFRWSLQPVPIRIQEERSHDRFQCDLDDQLFSHRILLSFPFLRTELRWCSSSTERFGVAYLHFFYCFISEGCSPMSARNFPPSFWNSNYVPPTPAPTHTQVSSSAFLDYYIYPLMCNTTLIPSNFI